jgi:DNA-binding NarL/FixJ family response regulator
MSYSTIPSRRVSIVGDNSLFEEGIAQLLAFGADLAVSNTKYTDDPAFLDAIAQIRPDVILLNESTICDSAHILELLFSIQSFTALSVIMVRLDNNVVDVYDVFEMPKQVTVTNRDELVAVVRGDFQQVISSA